MIVSHGGKIRVYSTDYILNVKNELELTVYEVENKNKELIEVREKGKIKDRELS